MKQPLVDVIAGVLAGHQWYDSTNELDGIRFGCTCLIDDEGNETALLSESPAAHQARAVLAAISEAGAVEWGTEYGPDDVEVSISQQSAEKFSRNHGNRPTVSRIAGPWEVAE